MRTTASFELFPDAPSERAIARARYLVREGRAADAEQAYRDVLAEHPDLKSGWAECFELLRDQGRREDALRLAEGARAQFGDQAFALALKGAALIELERYREAIATLEQAVESDPDLALVWHELGYAAFRLGDKNRALLALDRAFALEPHTETLQLRGRILRDAGRYQAAEVAFEGAAQAAEHADQRTGAEREIAVTQRYAFYAPRRPDELAPGERFGLALRAGRQPGPGASRLAHPGGSAARAARRTYRVRPRPLPAGRGPVPAAGGCGVGHAHRRRGPARRGSRIRARARARAGRRRRRCDRRIRRRRGAAHPPGQRPARPVRGPAPGGSTGRPPTQDRLIPLIPTEAP